jgi:DNA-binding NarL/FixJ family response regulator
VIRGTGSDLVQQQLRPHPPSVTPYVPRADEIRALHAEGKSPDQMAAALGYTRKTLLTYCSALGLKSNTRDTPRYDREALRRAVERGMTLDELAESFGVSKTAIVWGFK